ncbi:hypothetical protein KUTeg_004164 [Tegillarca granosa]|uniref:Uncharacterized protein n=1 Tax=Tegillarca granosa TaxID=220873 RepID=A0ABQ9FP98_TEGGR|nr:hypothetical protein KUTeg_004164 [Tegillarca granosa]
MSGFSTLRMDESEGLLSYQEEPPKDGEGSGIVKGEQSDTPKDHHCETGLSAGSELQSHTFGNEIDDIDDDQVQGQLASPEDNAKQNSLLDCKKKYFGDEIPRPHTLDLSKYSALGVGRLTSIAPMTHLVSGYRWDPSRFASQYNLSNSRSNLKKVPSGSLPLPREMPIKKTEKQLNSLCLKLILGNVSQLGGAEAALIFWKKEEILKAEALLKKSLIKNADPKTHVEFRKLRSRLVSNGFLEMESGGSKHVKKFMHFVVDSNTEETVFRALTETVNLQNVLIPIVKSDSLAGNYSDIVNAVNQYSKSCEQATVTILTDEDFLYEALTMCVYRLEEDQNGDNDTCSDTSDSVSSLDDVMETFSYVSINYHCRYYLNKKSSFILEHNSSEILRFRDEECMKLRYVVRTDLGQDKLKLIMKSSGGINLEFKYMDGKDEIYVESSDTLQGDRELEHWKRNVKLTLKNHIYEVRAVSLLLQKDNYKDVLDKLQKLRAVQKRQIIILTDSDYHIWIVGHSSSTKRAMVQAQKLIEEIKKARERITVTLNFAKSQMDILKGSEFYQTVLRMYSRLDVVLDENGNLAITGTFEETDNLKEQIKTWMKRLATFYIQPIEKTVWHLLEKTETQQYVIDSYKKNQIHCAFEVRQTENRLSLCVENAPHINNETINKLFWEFVVHYENSGRNVIKLMKLKWWRRKRKELLEKYPGKLCIYSEIEMGTLVINCTGDIKREVTGIISDALQHLDFEKKLRVSKEIVKYLRQFREQEISQLEYKHDVEIRYDSRVVESSKGSIGVKGIHYEVEEVYIVLKHIIDQIVSEKYLCTQQAAVLYFSKSERFINSLKKKLKCNIKIEKVTRTNSTAYNPTWSFNGCSFSVLGQDSTDAVVIHPIEQSSGKHEKLSSFTKSLETLKTPLVPHLYPKWKENDEKGMKQRKLRPQKDISDICFTITGQKEDVTIMLILFTCSMRKEIACILAVTGLPVENIKASIAASGVKYRQEMSEFVSDSLLQRHRSMPGINFSYHLDDEASCGQDNSPGYNLRKKYNNTMYVSSLDDFSEKFSKSIGHITIAYGNGTIYCTGFRAGVDYIWQQDGQGNRQKDFGPIQFLLNLGLSVKLTEIELKNFIFQHKFVFLIKSLM